MTKRGNSPSISNSASDALFLYYLSRRFTQFMIYEAALPNFKEVQQARISASVFDIPN